MTAAADEDESMGDVSGYGWDIGDFRPCGCPVEPVAVACDDHEGFADPSCSKCAFGVPGVEHAKHGCPGEQDDQS